MVPEGTEMFYQISTKKKTHNEISLIKNRI